MNNMGKPASPLAGGILLDAGTAWDDTYWEFLGTKGKKRYYHYIDGQWTEIDEDTYLPGVLAMACSSARQAGSGNRETVDEQDDPSPPA